MRECVIFFYYVMAALLFMHLYSFVPASSGIGGILVNEVCCRYLEEQGFVERGEWQGSSCGRSAVVDSKQSVNAPLKMVRGHGFIRAPAHQVLEVRARFRPPLLSSAGGAA